MKNKFYFLVIGIVWIALLPAQIPAGYYYLAQGKMKDNLKTALFELAQPRRVLKYGSGAGATWEGFFHTDQRANGSVYDMYSNIERFFNGFNSVSGMHIEHSFPKSWWGGANNTAYRDLFHLFPSDGLTNSTKNNFPLGIVGASPRLDNGVSKVGNNVFGGVYTGLSFEPANEYKGDFARAYLYISTVYQNLAPLWSSPMLQRNTYPVWVPWARNLLLQWHRNDPVSQKERLRQEAVFQIQHNRNPFIDYPQLVEHIWGPDTLIAFPFPVESQPFVVYPRVGEQITFDLILQGDSVRRNFPVRGVNMNTTTTIQLKHNSAHFFFTTTQLPPNEMLSGRTLTIGFSPQSSGVFRDTLVISGGGLAQPFEVPISGQAMPDFLTLSADEITPVGARLNWTLDPKANAYRILLYRGAQQAGNLLISTYVEWTGHDKAIVIYNGTGRTVKLEEYSLRRQSNGSGPFISNLPLRGELQNGQTHMVLHRLTTNQSLRQMAQFLTDSVTNFNGNDAIALLHHGLVIDMVGVPDGGDLLVWGLDKTLRRKSSVTHPQPIFNENEWETLPMNQMEVIGTHSMHFTPESTPLVHHFNSQGNSWTNTGLTPETTYTYRVESFRNGTHIPSPNTIQFTTAPLDAPVAMNALDVSDNRFVANWEQDLFVNTFQVDVFTMKGSGEVTVFEGFNLVGSNGRPLPEGWTGTASGNYTSTASSGAAIPSLQLAATGQFVQTPEYPHPVTFFEFMYRFPSTATGSFFFVEGLRDTRWERIDSIRFVNTSKYYVNYTFDHTLQFRAFRVTYRHKAQGNIALDDFKITYGSQTPEFLIQEVPVVGTELVVSNLLPHTTYFYRVRSTYSGKFSPWSESVSVQTHKVSSIPSLENERLIFPISGGIRLLGLIGGERVSVYNTSGMLLYALHASGNSLDIPMSESGVFIVAVKHPTYTLTCKIIR